MSRSAIAIRRRARSSKCASAAMNYGTANESKYKEEMAMCARKEQTTSGAGDAAPRANAFGMTFVLAPSFSLRVGCEDGLNFAAFTQQSGLAILIMSECQVTACTAELLNAKMHVGPEPILGADALLGPDACRLLSQPNAGGASLVSEAMSIEVLGRAFGAKLLKLELEIFYWPSSSSITDFTIQLEGVTLGVSVTRAMAAPGVKFGVEAATQLLLKKLRGVIRSTEACCGAWSKQVLHVWAPSNRVADTVAMAYATVNPDLAADTVVLVSVCEGLPLLFEEKQARSVVKAPRVLKGAKEAAHLRVLRESDPCRANL